MIKIKDVRGYPWGLEPQEGYEYVVIATACGADDHTGHSLCQLAEDPPAGAEPVSTPVLTDGGWKQLYRLPQPDWKKRVLRAIAEYENAVVAAHGPGREIYGDSEVAGKLLACEDLTEIFEAM